MLGWKVLGILLAGLGLVGYGYWMLRGRYDRPPSQHLMIERAFFKCDRCAGFQGGNYGKGPLEYFPTPPSRKCRHAWVRIPEDEFKKLKASAAAPR